MKIWIPVGHHNQRMTAKIIAFPIPDIYYRIPRQTKHQQCLIFLFNYLIIYFRFDIIWKIVGNNLRRREFFNFSLVWQIEAGEKWICGGSFASQYWNKLIALLRGSFIWSTNIETIPNSIFPKREILTTP